LIKRMKEMCVSNVKMSPITAELNCPSMEGEKILLSQRQLQRWHLMKMPEVGNRFERGRAENRCVLPAAGFYILKGILGMSYPFGLNMAGLSTLLLKPREGTVKKME